MIWFLERKQFSDDEWRPFLFYPVRSMARWALAKWRRNEPGSQFRIMRWERSTANKEK